jgi:hypothetical protein
VLIWSKIVVATDVVELGYNLLLSDTDMTYFRNVNKTFSLWLRHTQADGAMLTEEGGGWPSGYINLVNTGSMLFVSNHRTKQLMRRVLTEGRVGPPPCDVPCMGRYRAKLQPPPPPPLHPYPPFRNRPAR